MQARRQRVVPMIRRVMVLAGVVLLGVIVWRVYSNLNAGQSSWHDHHGPTIVDAVRAVRQPVPVVVRATGHAETEHSVAVRAQVGGLLKQVLFHEGDEVKAGQLLFVIDPEPYRIQVAQSEGQVKQDEARLEADRANAKRMSGLTKGGFVSPQDLENAKATVKEDEASIATDKAKLAEAQMQLGYTRITAPIDGKTGALAYKSGNLVQAGSSTPLVTINQIAPIQVQFDVPQSRLPAVLRYYRAGTIEVSALESDGTPIESDGKLVFIDNGINQSSGTVSLKARFPNGDRKIWPGQLMAVNLTLTVEKDALVVPSIAVQPGQNSNFVYTVANGKVKVRNVDVKRQYQGLSVLGNDLAPGDVVVVRVPRDLKDGIAAKAHIVGMSDAVANADPAAE